MKKVLLVLAMMVLYSSSYSDDKIQKIERILPITKEKKSVNWYIDQSKLWKKGIEENKQNAFAWYNYYMASRNCLLLGADKSKYENLGKIVDRMEKHIPETYEFNYLKYRQIGDYNCDDCMDYLDNAYKIAPERPGPHIEYVTRYEIDCDVKKRMKFSKKLYDANYYSYDIMAWNYNVLQGCEPSSILFTNGDNDTYPLWVLQDAQFYNADVMVLNVNLLLIDHYREKIFQKLKMKDIHIDSKTFQLPDGRPNAIKKVISHIIDNSKDRSVYFALTLYPKYYEHLKKNLYLTGTTLKYSKSDFDNMAIIRKNYENVYFINYLRTHLHKDESFYIAMQLNRNYLPMLLKLEEHYDLTDEDRKHKKVAILKNYIISTTESLNRKFGN